MYVLVPACVPVFARVFARVLAGFVCVCVCVCFGVCHIFPAAVQHEAQVGGRGGAVGGRGRWRGRRLRGGRRSYRMKAVMINNSEAPKCPRMTEQ